MDIYLNSYGFYLHVKDAMFEVRLPAAEPGGAAQKHLFAAHKVRSILLTTTGALSTDAVRLALKNNVDILFVEGEGTPLGRVWHSKLGSTTRIRKRQLEASIGAEGVRYTKAWIGRKLDNQLEMLRDLRKHRTTLHATIDHKLGQLQALAQSLQLLEAPRTEGIADTLRGLEGTAGRLYFETLSLALPPEHQFAGRSARPARDPFNAFLNYGYGILYGRIEKSLILAGLDPYVGFLHRDDYNQKSMVFDFIEPYRIGVERVVMRLFAGKKVSKAHTSAITNGFTLNKEGKVLLVEAYNQFFQGDKIRYRGRQQTRENALQFDAHTFANELIGKSQTDEDQEEATV